MPSKVLPVQAVVLVSLISFAIYLIAQPRQTGTPSPTPAQHTMGTRPQANGIPNFGQVTPNLYRGGLPNNQGIGELKKLGVNVVVDLRGRNKGEEAEVTRLGMQYVPIPSHCPFPGDAPYAKFLKVVQENPGKKVFVHCRLGDDRTGMAVASYRMADEGWSADEAMKEMKEFGFSTVHHMICPGMADYEKNFPQRLKTSPAFKSLQQQNPPQKAK